MQTLVQSLPQASRVQSIPTILLAPQIPVVHPSVPYLQVPFQGLTFEGLFKLHLFKLNFFKVNP